MGAGQAAVRSRAVTFSEGGRILYSAGAPPRLFLPSWSSLPMTVRSFALPAALLLVAPLVAVPLRAQGVEYATGTTRYRLSTTTKGSQIVPDGQSGLPDGSEAAAHREPGASGEGHRGGHGHARLARISRARRGSRTCPACSARASSPTSRRRASSTRASRPRGTTPCSSQVTEERLALPAQLPQGHPGGHDVGGHAQRQGEPAGSRAGSHHRLQLQGARRHERRR